MDRNKGKTEESADNEEKEKWMVIRNQSRRTIPPIIPRLVDINENQKDRTDIITRSSIGAIEKEENGSASLVTKPVLNTHDESSEDDDNDHEDKDDDNDKVDDDGGDYHNDMPGLQDDYNLFVTQDMYEYNFLFPNEMLGLELTGGGRKKAWVSKVNIEELKNSICINDNKRNRTKWK